MSEPTTDDAQPKRAPRKPSGIVRLEPALVDDRAAAAFLGISPRLLLDVADREQLKKIKVPGVRRSVYAVEDLRRVADRWRMAAD